MGGGATGEEAASDKSRSGGYKGVTAYRVLDFEPSF